MLGVGANPPYVDPSPTAAWDSGTLAINPSGVSYTVRGWAFDPDSPQQSIHVDVYDQRPDGSSAGTRLTTGVARPDVARRFPGTAKESVDVYVAGPAGTPGTRLTTGGARPDVTRALPWAGPETGFSGRVATAGSGTSKVCAYAIGVLSSGTHPLIACRSVQVG